MPILAVTRWLPVPPEGTPGWWYVTALLLAVIVMGIAKSGFGGGIGILAVPLVLNALPPSRALGVMLPILIAADVLAVYQHRKQQSWPHLRPALIGAGGGIAVGTAALFLLIHMRGGEQAQAVIGNVLRVLVGSICLILVGLQCFRLMGGRVRRLPDNRSTGVLVGAVAGFVSMIAHAAGPIMSVYWLDQRMTKRLLTGSLVLFFFLVNSAKLPSYLALGWINVHTLVESALFGLAVPVGSLLGIAMHRRIPEKPFAVVMYLGAAAAGVGLILKAVG